MVKNIITRTLLISILTYSSLHSVSTKAASVDIGGIPDISTVADIIKIKNNGGTYEITKNGVVVPNTSGQYNLYGTDIYIKIESGNAIVYSPLLPITGNPASYPLPVTGNNIDLTFMKERVEQADGVTINTDGYVLLIADGSLNAHNGQIWSSASFDNKGIIVGYTDASNITFLTENGSFNNSGKIYLNSFNSGSEINVNNGNFTNSGEINTSSYSNFYVSNGNALNTGIINIIGNEASLSLYTNRGNIQNDNIIKLDTLSGHLQINSQEGDFINNGTIETKFGYSTSVGIYSSEGSFTNNGTIKITGQEHVFTSLSSYGENKYFNNYGTIDIKASGGHLSLNAYNFLNTNTIDVIYDGTTQVSGGIYIYAQNDFVNKGTINTLVKSDDNTGSSGLSLNSGGSLINQGTITYDSSQIENSSVNIYADKGEFNNSGTMDLKSTDYTYIQAYSNSSDPKDFINTGTMSLQNNRYSISATSYYGNFKNLGKLTMNVLNQDSGQNGFSEIGIHENVSSSKTINRGLIDIQGYNNFAVIDSYMEGEVINNYGDIYLSKETEFGYSKYGTFYQLHDYMRILSADEGIKRDFAYITTAASVNDLQSNGITDFYKIGAGKVYKEESAPSVMPDHGIAGTRVQYNGKWYWEVETGTLSGFNFMNDIVELSNKSALYLETGKAYELTDGVVNASIYSLIDTTASPKPSVDNTLVLNKSSAGTLVLNGHNNWYNGVFNLTGGDVKAMVDNSIFGGTVNMSNDTLITTYSNQDIQNLNLSGGKITFDRTEVRKKHNPLTRSGLYKGLTVKNLNSLSGTNIITLNTDLGDDSSNSDRVILTGTVTGKTFLNIIDTPFGNDGENVNGIMVVDATATTTTADNFELLGGQVDGGAHVYKLYRGNSSDSNSFFLSNTGLMTDTLKTMINMPAVHVNIVKTGMNELRKRMGELRDNSPEHKSGAWIRTYAKNLDISELLHSKMNIYGVEAGYDKQIISDCDKKVYVGIMAGYMHTDNIRTKQRNGISGSGNANTPTIGLYATWLNKNGWFIDGTFRNFWSNLNSKSYTAANQPIMYNSNRVFHLGSIEFGRNIRLNKGYKEYLTIEPKFEAVYGYASSKRFRNSRGTEIYFSDTKTFTNRASLKLGYSKELNNGSIVEPFAEIALIKEWEGKTDISYAGTDCNSDISGTSAELSVGLNSKIDKNWSLYSDVAFEKGDVIQAFSGNVGIRYNF